MKNTKEKISSLNRKIEKINLRIDAKEEKMIARGDRYYTARSMHFHVRNGQPFNTSIRGMKTLLPLYQRRMKMEDELSSIAIEIGNPLFYVLSK